MILPPTLRTYAVAQSVLDDTRALFADSSSQGVECVVVWVGQPRDATSAVIAGAIRPGQVAYRSELGLSVEVPQDALSELISAIPDDMAILARVHTHPTDAYHSTMDDTNLLLAHVGAISIVVPDFARHPITLGTCSINELTNDGTWRELRASEVTERFKVFGD